MARFFNVRQAPLVDYRFTLPFQEIAQTQAQLQQRYDVTAAGLEKAQDAAAALDAYWDPDKEYLRGFQGRMDDLSDKYLGQNLADPAVGMRLRNDIRTLARDPNLSVIQRNTMEARQLLEDRRKMMLEGKFNPAQLHAWNQAGAAYNASGTFDPQWRAPGMLTYADPKQTALDVIKALPSDEVSWLSTIGAADGSVFHTMTTQESRTLDRIVRGVQGMLDQNEITLLRAEHEMSGSSRPFNEWLGSWLATTASGFEFTKTTRSGLQETRASKRRGEELEGMSPYLSHRDLGLFTSEAGTLPELVAEAKKGNAAARTRIDALAKIALPDDIANAQTPQQLVEALMKPSNRDLVRRLQTQQSAEEQSGRAVRLGQLGPLGQAYALGRNIVQGYQDKADRRQMPTADEIVSLLPENVSDARGFLLEVAQDNETNNALLAELGAGDYITRTRFTPIREIDEAILPVAKDIMYNSVGNENIIEMSQDGKLLMADGERAAGRKSNTQAVDAANAFAYLQSTGKFDDVINSAQYGNYQGKPVMRLTWADERDGELKGQYTATVDISNTNLPATIARRRAQAAAETGLPFEQVEDLGVNAMTQVLYDNSLSDQELTSEVLRVAQREMQALGIPAERAAGALLAPTPTLVQNNDASLQSINVTRDAVGLRVSVVNPESGMRESVGGLTPEQAAEAIAQYTRRVGTTLASKILDIE